MSFRKAIASNVAVQAIGPASTFLTVFIIARRGGPSDQGQYAQMKAWVDLVVALGCFGFPQAFVYVINKAGASATTLARWSCLYSLGFIPIAFVGSDIAVQLRLVSVPSGIPIVSIAILTVSAAVLVLHGLWRGIYLSYNPRIPFAVFTILPAVALSIFATVTMFSAWRRFDWMIFFATIPAITVAALMMRPITGVLNSPRYRDQPWRPLFSNGLHAFLQALLTALQPVIAYRLIRFEGGDNREIAFVNVGLFFVQGLTVPIAMVAPLLFARWTSAADWSLLGRLNRLTVRAVLAGVAIGAVLALAISPIIPVIFGRQYLGATSALQFMLLTVPLVCHVRIVAPALHANGYPIVNTTAGIVRLCVFFLIGVLLQRVIHNCVSSTALAWALAEVVSATWSLSALRYLTVRMVPS